MDGVTPSQVNQENYLEMLKVMKAKPREDRPMNTEDAHKKLAKILGGG